MNRGLLTHKRTKGLLIAPAFASKAAANLRVPPTRWLPCTVVPLASCAEMMFLHRSTSTPAVVVMNRTAINASSKTIPRTPAGTAQRARNLQQRQPKNRPHQCQQLRLQLKKTLLLLRRQQLRVEAVVEVGAAAAADTHSHTPLPIIQPQSAPPVLFRLPRHR